LSWHAQRHLIEPHADDRQRNVARIFHRRMVLGEQRDLLRSIVILPEKLDGSTPRSLLPAVEFAEVERVPLDAARMAAPLVLDDTPVTVFLAILAAFCAT